MKNAPATKVSALPGKVAVLSSPDCAAKSKYTTQGKVMECLLELSEEVQAYVNKVEDEVGLPVSIQVVEGVGLPGMVARFSEQDYPTNILITITPSIQKMQLEIIILHEVTHGFLAYSKYYQWKFKREVSNIEMESIRILRTITEDIVVNKILQEEGFQPINEVYLSVLQRETEAAHNGQDFYRQFQPPIVKSRFMVLRYILAWGYLEYFYLEADVRKILARFVEEFEMAYPEEYRAANQIRAIIQQNDIFTSSGFYQAIQRGLEFWGLGDSVELTKRG